ncbi:ricin-type beta-trefoil lectin domain protein [Marinobacter zhejiangensis]|uniref:Membrane dipeptidase (Peptidase family M19) n=1 Tax=Marinobacter zhejiangensis TaxID=488535 RepID=A0A1I4Q4A5_9GAMM|nr:ricin-type beta-trefoil lectin domain protein [Marinobacter zhejiangensis]SFM34928.1 Membrane dipeptidase (Peptidase family M19) [Marinobacter zhejiangensis]
MKPSVIAAFATALAASFVCHAQAADENEAVYSLAQGCYAIQSPHNNQYMRRYQTSGTINDGWSFDFRASSPESAARFYLKPSVMGSYLLRDTGGRYLDTRFPADITAGTVTGKHADWKVDARQVGNEYLYRFTSHSLDRWLRHNWNSQGIYFIDLFNPFFLNSEEWFRLVPQTGCTPVPEVDVNVTGDFNALKGIADLPVRGSIDPHTHITSYEFMGGTMMAGEPFNRYGVTKALADSSDIHGSWGSLDVIGNLMGFNDLNFRYDTRGWPDFPFWPNHQSLSHMGYYYRWMERAYKGGQRMMVTHLVENEVLCNIQSTLLPQSWRPTNSCNTMDSVDLQILRLHELQDYIDAQEGGPGKGFFRLVRSPEEARSVIADGKMAVLMGIEVSELFNCGIKDAACSQAYVEQQLQKYHDLGVRAIYPIHRFDNQFGGARIESGLINVGNNMSTGRYFSTEACDDDTQGQMMSNDLGLFGLEVLLGVSGSTNYDETVDQCNTRSLTELGVYLVNRMMDLGMIVELDHMSQATHNAVLDIAEARGYSGLITGHSHMHAGTNDNVHPDKVRLAQLGGILAPYNWDAYSISGSISRYLDVVEQTPYLNGVPFSTDMSGIGHQPGPRSDAAINPLEYPFTTEFGLTVERQQSGNRTFDLNVDGVAHYGMVADHIQDIRERAPGRIYEAVMNSAEAYLQMWERADANSDDHYMNPLPPFVRVYNRGTGTCLDVPGNDDGVNQGAWVGHYDCQVMSQDQRWLYDPASGTLANQVHGASYCLDNNGTPWNNGYPNLQACDNSAEQTWTYQNQRVKSVGSDGHSLDAYSSGWVGFWESHGGGNQQWEFRLDDGGSRWTEYRSVRSGKCLSVASQGQLEGSELTLAACDASDGQRWMWNPSAGTLATALDSSRCVAIPGGNYGNLTRLRLEACNGTDRQRFERHSDQSFRAVASNGYAIDAAGDDVILYWNHGGTNQRWIPTLQ